MSASYLAQLEAMWAATASLMSCHRADDSGQEWPKAAELKPLLLELERQIKRLGGSRPDASGTLLGFTDRIAWGGEA